MGSFAVDIELRKIRRKSFLVNPLTPCTRGCVAEVSEERFRNSVVIYETFYGIRAGRLYCKRQRP